MEIANNTEQLIARYLNGECSGEEQKEIRRWIEASDENKKLFFRIKDTWDASRKLEDKSDQALLQFYKKKAHQKTKSSKLIQMWRWAASSAAVFLIGLLSVVILNRIENPEPQLITLKVPLGSRSEVTLADGTQVVLNSGSEIIYPGVFNSNQREVTLKGEAFFNVISNSSYPFIVKTSDFHVRVTGTQFNVCNYSDNNYSSVTLAKGKVDIEFSGDKQRVAIKSGEQFKLNRENRKYCLFETDVDADLAWKSGEFSFKEIPFLELIKRLERWYDVTLTYSAKELETMQYTGRFKNQETIWQVLDALKLTTAIGYEKAGFREFKIIYKPMKKNKPDD